MANKGVSLRLIEAVYFQTIIGARQTSGRQTPGQSHKRQELGPNNQYRYPEGFALEEMISDAKKTVRQDKASKGVFHSQICAETEIGIGDAHPYLSRIEELDKDLIAYLTEKKDRPSRERLPIQSHKFSGRVFDLDQSYIELRDSTQEERSILFSYCMVDGVSNPHKIIMGLLKSDDTNCTVERLERFYDAANALYTKLSR